MMINNRGFTILELLVASFAAVFVLLAVGSFFTAMTRFVSQRDSGAYLERQGGLIIDEMVRQVRPATAALTVGTCHGAGSLGVTNPSGTYCFYQSGTQLLEDRTVGGSTGTKNLLALGSLANMSAQQNSDGTPTFTATLWGTQCAGVAGCKVTVTFQIGDCLARSAAADACNFMRFTTDMTRRN